jgi:hypothetical protein
MKNQLLGLMVAAAMASIYSPHACGLDFDSAVQKQDAEAAQILSTLSRPVNSVTPKSTNLKVKVALLSKKAASSK